MTVLSRRALAPVLAASALAVAGCGADDEPAAKAPATPAPSAAKLMTEAVRATQGATSAAFKLDFSLSAASKDPKVRQFLSKPIGLTVAGGASKGAVTLEGSARWMGRNDRVAVRADAKRSFVQFGGTWYGPGDGIDSAKSQAGERADKAETERALRFLRAHGDELVTGKVAPGPDIDGPTWQLAGTLDADGIVAAAKAEGEPLDGEAQTVLRALAPLVKVTFAAGQEDKRIRRVGLRIDLSKAQIDRINALTSDGDEMPLDRLAMRTTMDFSKWNQPVKVTAPTGAQPIDALGGALFGALLGAGAGAGTP